MDNEEVFVDQFADSPEEAMAWLMGLVGDCQYSGSPMRISSIVDWQIVTVDGFMGRAHWKVVARVIMEQR